MCDDYYQLIQSEKRDLSTYSKTGSKNVDLLMSCKPKLLHLLLNTAEYQYDVLLAGEGKKPIFFIPPLNINWLIFTNQIKTISSEHKGIICHLPGCGFSKPIDDISIDNVSRLLIGAVDALDFKEPIHLMAASFGGVVAQHLAAKFPKRIASLTLISPFYETPDLKPLVADTPYEDELEFMNNMFNYELDRLVKNNLYDTQKENVETLIAYYEKCKEKNWEVALRYQDVFSTVSNKDLLYQIECPTLIINGKHDFLVHKTVGQEIHSRIPNSQLYEIEAGHFSPLTHPEKIDDLVSAFLKGLDSNQVNNTIEKG
jgi:pimeloyl-ACP methyl ester carboxylesterase